MPQRFIVLIMFLMAVVILLRSRHRIFAAAQAREEFHSTYPLTDAGQIDVDNVNGSVHLRSGEAEEVKVDAVKTGDADEIGQTEIQVDNKQNHLRIHTQIPNHSGS